MTEQFRFLKSLPVLKLQKHQVSGNCTDSTLFNKLCSLNCFIDKLPDVIPTNFSVDILEESKIKV